VPTSLPRLEAKIKKVKRDKALFSKLQALPKNGKAVAMWTNRDDAWTDVAEGMEKAAEKIRAKRKKP
jgi:hypothetical protein